RWDIDPITRPGLAVWRTGNKADQLQVAFAWEDQHLYLWDVATSKPPITVDEAGKWNNSVAYYPDRTSILAGSFSVNQGQVRVWQVVSGAEPRPSAQPGRAFPQDSQGHYFFPRAITLFSSQGDGKLDCAALVLRAIKDQGPQKEEQVGLC